MQSSQGDLAALRAAQGRIIEEGNKVSIELLGQIGDALIRFPEWANSISDKVLWKAIALMPHTNAFLGSFVVCGGVMPPIAELSEIAEVGTRIAVSRFMRLSRVVREYGPSPCIVSLLLKWIEADCSRVASAAWLVLVDVADWGGIGLERELFMACRRALARQERPVLAAIASFLDAVVVGCHCVPDVECLAGIEPTEAMSFAVASSVIMFVLWASASGIPGLWLTPGILLGAYARLEHDAENAFALRYRLREIGPEKLSAAVQGRGELAKLLTHITD